MSAVTRESSAEHHSSTASSATLPTQDQRTKLYKCTSCPRRFRTPQALNGHQHVHRPTKRDNGRSNIDMINLANAAINGMKPRPATFSNTMAMNIAKPLPKPLICVHDGASGSAHKIPSVCPGHNILGGLVHRPLLGEWPQVSHNQEARACDVTKNLLGEWIPIRNVGMKDAVGPSRVCHVDQTGSRPGKTVSADLVMFLKGDGDNAAAAAAGLEGKMDVTKIDLELKLGF